MNELEKLQKALAMIEAAQSLLAEAGREIFDTCRLEKERAAIWSEHERVKKLWHRLRSRATALRLCERKERVA